MSIAPESLAASRFHELRKLDEKVKRLGQELAEARQAGERLEARERLRSDATRRPTPPLSARARAGRRVERRRRSRSNWRTRSCESKPCAWR